MENEIIVDVGAEGGGLTLYGVRKGRGWLYSRHLFDQTLSWAEDGPVAEHDSEVVSTWEAALKLLDKYKFHLFFPLQVHPEFQAKVLKAVVTRNKRDSNEYGLDRWQRVCGMPAEN